MAHPSVNTVIGYSAVVIQKVTETQYFKRLFILQYLLFIMFVYSRCDISFCTILNILGLRNNNFFYDKTNCELSSIISILVLPTNLQNNINKPFLLHNNDNVIKITMMIIKNKYNNKRNGDFEKTNTYYNSTYLYT